MANMETRLDALKNTTRDEEHKLTPIQVEARIERTRELICLYNQPRTFKVGDVVTHAPGLRNRKEHQPMVVVQVLDAPVYDTSKSAGSPYFREPLTIVAAEVDAGVMLLFYYDANRLMHYKQ